MTPLSDKVVPIRVPVPVAATQGTLALDLQPSLEPPPAAVVPIGRQRRHSAEEWARRFAQAAVEIVGGDRPPSQLLRWTSKSVYADLERRALLVARAGGHVPGQGRVQPVTPRVRSVHTSFVTPDVVEASVHATYGPRSRAVAARFELRKGRWLCTALEFA
jgi:uncharacterized protein DUF6459